jgi:hypothetical protein
MGQAQFCSYMTQALSQSGMSTSQYIAQMKQVEAFVPADSKADFEQFLQMIAACG